MALVNCFIFTRWRFILLRIDPYPDDGAPLCSITLKFTTVRHIRPSERRTINIWGGGGWCKARVFVDCNFFNYERNLFLEGAVNFRYQILSYAFCALSFAGLFWSTYFLINSANKLFLPLLGSKGVDQRTCWQCQPGKHETLALLYKPINARRSVVIQILNYIREYS